MKGSTPMLAIFLFVALIVVIIAILAALLTVLDALGSIVKAGETSSWNNKETRWAIINTLILTPASLVFIAFSTALVLWGLTLAYDALAF